MRKIRIGNRFVGEGEPTYCIAEIGSNFDGSIQRAKDLVDLAVSVGADAAKFQSFESGKIICKEAFQEKSSFQAKWDKPVWDVYQAAEFPREWHLEIAEYCKSKGIDFFSSPYDREAVDLLDEIGCPAFKVGSGDITWLEMLKYIASKGKPVILGVGASTLGEIDEAVKAVYSTGNKDLILLQCITNYPSPFEQANIKAMVTLKNIYQVPVGYSDHTPGDIVPLGTVALGGCIIEKHFTDDKTRKGPDHPFAMDGADFKKMVERIRTLESALGSYHKDIVEAESETVILQRRSVYAARDIAQGETIIKDALSILRPAKGILPKDIDLVIGHTASCPIKKGEPVTWEKL